MTTHEKAATALLDQIVKILQDENWLGLPGASVLPLLTNAFECAWVDGDRHGQREHATAVDIVAARATRNAEERDEAQEWLTEAREEMKRQIDQAMRQQRRAEQAEAERDRWRAFGAAYEIYSAAVHAVDGRDVDLLLVDVENAYTAAIQGNA